MNIEEELKKSVAARQVLLSKLTQLRQAQQDTLQEILRSDGEIRILERLSKEESNGK